MITFALTLMLLTVGLPVAAFYGGAWLITAAYDEESVLRRGLSRLAAAAG